MRPHWRKMTWVVIGWCALIVFWIVAAGVSAGNEAHKYCTEHETVFLTLKACEEARHVGTGIGVALILVIGFTGFVFFSLIWLMTRPKGRSCPVCGEDVKKGLTVCDKCGFDFAAAAAGATQPQPTVTS
jgi:hypothetical protein